MNIKGRDKTIEKNLDKPDLNLAIVGGGKACKFFLDLLQHEPYSSLNIKIVGVCDINPEAEGLQTARELGIYTTSRVEDLFKLKDLDSVLETTNSQEVLLELIHKRPEGVGVMDYNLGRLVRRLSDVDQRLKSAEHQLALEKMASNFLIQQANERIVVLNPDFTIVEANEAYAKAVNRSKEEVIGSHCYEMTHGLDVPCQSSHPELGCPMVETLRTGESAHVIHEHPQGGDEFTYCDMVTYPVKNQEGEIVRVIEIWRDITEELASRLGKRVQELKDDFKKLIQEDRMISLGKLVASCVHEINNPIQGLLTFSQLMGDTLKKGALNRGEIEEFKKFLSLMSAELERCGNIVSGLLSFSREPLMEYTDVDLSEVLQAVIALTRHKMELQNIRLHMEISSQPKMIRGDVNQLQQCLMNLIFNAIEAMPNGGELSTILSLDRAERLVQLEIKDTGCGIRAEDLDYIFDPFFTTKREGEGTGLGLSIVHGVVKTHGGDIRVKSEAGKGSAFSLHFPSPY